MKRTEGKKGDIETHQVITIVPVGDDWVLNAGCGTERTDLRNIGEAEYLSHRQVRCGR